MIRKATRTIAAGQKHAARVQDRISEYHLRKSACRVHTDPTPGHILARLQNAEKVLLDAIPITDRWQDADMVCGYCEAEVFTLFSTGIALILERAGKHAVRHACPKMKPHNGVFLK